MSELCKKCNKNLLYKHELCRECFRNQLWLPRSLCVWSTKNGPLARVCRACQQESPKEHGLCEECIKERLYRYPPAELCMGRNGLIFYICFICEEKNSVEEGMCEDCLSKYTDYRSFQKKAKTEEAPTEKHRKWSEKLTMEIDFPVCPSCKNRGSFIDTSHSEPMLKHKMIFECRTLECPTRQYSATLNFSKN